MTLRKYKRMSCITLSAALVTSCADINTGLFVDDKHRSFLVNNPRIAASVPYIESITVGRVVDAEVAYEYADESIIEYEVLLPDGRSQELLYSLSGGKVISKSSGE